jgi:hypothetical protein
MSTSAFISLHADLYQVGGLILVLVSQPSTDVRRRAMRNKLQERVAISGVGCSRFGDLLETPELKGLSIQEVTASAVKEALDDAGVTGQDEVARLI